MNANAATTHWDLFILHGVNPTGKEIGRGAYGRVFEVNYEGILCAAKEVHALLLQYAQGQDLQKIKEDFLNECQLWSALRHPCVVQFLGSVTTDYLELRATYVETYGLVSRCQTTFSVFLCGGKKGLVSLVNQTGPYSTQGAYRLEIISARSEKDLAHVTVPTGTVSSNVLISR